MWNVSTCFFSAFNRSLSALHSSYQPSSWLRSISIYWCSMLCSVYTSSREFAVNSSVLEQLSCCSVSWCKSFINRMFLMLMKLILSTSFIHSVFILLTSSEEMLVRAAIFSCSTHFWMLLIVEKFSCRLRWAMRYLSLKLFWAWIRVKGFSPIVTVHWGLFVACDQPDAWDHLVRQSLRRSHRCEGWRVEVSDRGHFFDDVSCPYVVWKTR